MSWFSRVVVRHLRTRFISGPQRSHRHIRKWFQVWELKGSAGTRNRRVAMLYLFGKTSLVFALFSFIPSVSTCAGGRAKHNPTRDGPIVCGLWESICQRIFPLRIRPNKGRRAYPFLTYSQTHTTLFFIVSISTLPSWRKFFWRRYYDMNKRREFYRPRTSVSLSCDES